MRDQPPGDNNPANPLLKVAAFQIERIPVDNALNNQGRIVVGLSFKRSDDMRGKAMDKQGRAITVTFGLSIKRASLELSVVDDRGNPATQARISKVAFVSALANKNRVASERVATRERRAKLGVFGKVGARLGAAGVSPDGGGGLGAEASIGVTNKEKRKLTSKYETTNVSATFAGHTVHWEITPNDRSNLQDSERFLQGEVFLNSQGRQIDACVVTRKDGGSVGSLDVTGSVFANMESLVVENLKFMYDDGTEVRTSNVATDQVEKSVLDFRGSDLKARLLKQIIRKHLLRQGMKSDGAAVEICRGST